MTVATDSLRCLLTPQVVVDAVADVDEVPQTLHNAHKSCLVGRSVTTTVEVQPTATVMQ